ncbi:MAG: Mycothiol acetyltransferase [Candidatus Ordinivivax streblomastigis]|uniref:Mycothiol acetyltransferase n=1 Tax=Candidatus Ordinivivax streblomastigis TaxID=2540710 RepID=A0A5M8NZX8_9BACT|nr:MAG: Mycothiol acetyltransferase [Candidatus Ordinivivax streblomastigis]
MDKVVIREITTNELSILEDLLYESVYQPDETNLVPREVVNIPQIRVYIDKFGQKEDDYCLVADLDNQIIGGVWIRILADEIKGYGNVDNQTPEFAISLFKEYRNCGIGTQLMQKMIAYLTEQDYYQTSLSVQKENYAVKMYRKLGFEIISENSEDYVMLLKLN